MRFTRRVAAGPATVEQALDFMRRNPGQTAVLTDCDGVLAPIVPRDHTAHIPGPVRADLRRIHARYRLTAVITGRRARDAYALVAVPGIHVSGNFGSERMTSEHGVVLVNPPFLLWRRKVRRFAELEWTQTLRAAGAIREDKGSVIVFHWRGAADEDATRLAIEAAAQRAADAGLGVTRGKKAIEFGPPVPVNKGTAVRALLRRRKKIRCAIYFGDDLGDIPAMNALEALVAAGRLDFALRVAVASPETPDAVIAAANYVVNGTEGVAAVLQQLAKLPAAAPLQQ
jgi:trehalose 6-phosphate phosphatase